MPEFTQIEVLLKTLNIVLSIAGFFGGLAVLALFKMARDINSIKTFNEVQAVKHDQLSANHEKLEERVKLIEQNK